MGRYAARPRLLNTFQLFGLQGTGINCEDEVIAAMSFWGVKELNHQITTITKTKFPPNFPTIQYVAVGSLIPRPCGLGIS